jgi:hypothetical protein
MDEHISPTAEEQITRLIAFRQAAYHCLGNGRDALFDLMDAVLLTPAIHSLADLSLSPVFRRRWPSVYAALRDGVVDRHALLRLYASHLPAGERPVLAGDPTAWPRPKARTLRDRTFEHQPTLITGNRPVTIGQGYSTLAWIPKREGSWALPLLHERIGSAETPIGKAAEPLRRACQLLPKRPLSLHDSEYGNASFVLATADIPADRVMRLRPNLCLRGPKPPYSGTGRPAEHGEKFKLNDPATWTEPIQTLEVDDPKLGRVRVRMWSDLHFLKAKAHPMFVVLIERLEAKGTKRDPTTLWLCWIAEEAPPLEEGWRFYLRRFAIEHWYRFAKQRQHWTRPHLATPEQSQTWSDLMPLLTWLLWLARALLQDKPLPWQKPQADLTPGRAAQGWGGVLAVIGTPAAPPKVRGKSPGWPKGRRRRRREVFAVVKKDPKRAKMALPLAA